MSPGLRPPYRGTLPPSSGEINADSTPKVPSCEVCSFGCCGEGSLGTPPALGLLLPAFQPPLSRSAKQGPVAADFSSRPSTETSCSKESELTEKMWKVPVLLLVLGRASLWFLAEGAITVRPEDDIRTQGVEDGMVTPGASEDPYQSVDWTALVPTSTKSTVTRIEDLPTSESTVHAQEESQSTTASNMATSHSMGDTQTTIEKDGLATGTLIGITVGVLLAIGFVGGIIIVVVRKMSGRYSP